MGELLVFTYKAKIVYFAHVASGVEQERGKKYFCIDMITCKRCNDKSVKEFGDRIGEKFIGQAWNRVEGRDEEIETILLEEYLHEIEISKEANKPNKTRAGKKGYGKPLSKEEIRQIEDSAVAKVTEYYENKGYEVISVEKDNVGWDLYVYKKNDELRVEVKGHKYDQIKFVLTPNEYEQMKNKKNYRVCVVCNALTEEFCLDEFFPHRVGKTKKWILKTEDGSKIVRLEEKIAAQAVCES